MLICGMCSVFICQSQSCSVTTVTTVTTSSVVYSTGAPSHLADLLHPHHMCLSKLRNHQILQPLNLYLSPPLLLLYFPHDSNNHLIGFPFLYKFIPKHECFLKKLKTQSSFNLPQTTTSSDKPSTSDSFILHDFGII